LNGLLIALQSPRQRASASRDQAHPKVTSAGLSTDSDGRPIGGSRRHCILK